MARSGDGDPENFKRYQEVCAALNLDRYALDEAWQSYQRISASYTLEGDCLHWLACALYVACRKGSVPMVGRGAIIEGNCVSLTRLLRSCKLSLVQFFNKMKKWSDMANLSHDMRQKVDRLERNFNVSTVIFKKFEPIFLDIFEDPNKDLPKATRGRKQRKLPCTSTEVFSFCWTLFVHVKGHFSAISDDLVNSFHLLLCCVDLLYSNAITSDRRDILKKTFAGLPERFNEKEYKIPTDAPCIIDWLCKAHQGLVVEAKGIKEHWWKPYIKRMIEKKVLKGKIDGLSSVLEITNFESNCKLVNKEYETFVLNSGDFDERIFLGENANEEIGAPARYSNCSALDMDYQMRLKNSLQTHLENSHHLRQATPLTGRRYLQNKESSGSTPVSMATQSVQRLQNLLAERKAFPSEALMSIFEECSSNPHDTVMARVNEMGETFCTCFSEPSDGFPDSHLDFAKKRLQLGQTLYFKALENISIYEKKKLPPKTDLSGLLEHDAFQQSLFACCLEIVIFSYNSQRMFPWILDTFDLQPYYFYKVIEVLIRGEEGLSRDVVKHLNHIEEQILESLAWKSESPLWDALKTSTVPSCEEVSLPNQMDHSQATGPGSAIQLLQSPLANPVVRRCYVRRDATPQSPLASPAGERLNTIFPTNGAAVTASGGARRRLFRAEGLAAAAAAPGGQTSTESGDNQRPVATLVSTPSRPASIILQTVQDQNGITYGIPIPTISLPPSMASPAPPPAVQTPPDSNTGPETVRPPAVPRRGGSLGLFFRKVYHLAGVRLKELCDRLNVANEELRRQIWTCFEHSLMHSTDLMCDRHMDQLIMCAVYVICKVVKKEDQSFQEIMRCYRLQPQATSHVYRSVLIVSKKRRNSGSSDNSKSGGAASPTSGDKEGGEVKRNNAECLSSIRSSSTLPVPHPNSQPPTPTRLAGTGTHFEFEDRGDLITFYNKVYVPLLQKFAVKFSQTSGAQVDSPPLSPLPRLNANPMSPFRRVLSKHSIYLSPLKNPNFPPSPSRPLSYSLGRSPAKDLHAINKMLQMGEKKVGKRILQDQDERENESPSKKLNEDLAFRKIHNVMAERQGAGTIPE